MIPPVHNLFILYHSWRSYSSFTAYFHLRNSLCSICFFYDT